MAKSEAFSNVDAAWLHMETPTNMAMITGVYMFDEPLDYDRLKKTIEYRLVPHKRFRQRVKQPWLPLRTPRWEFDPYFDLNAHMHRVAIPTPGDHAALQELAGDLMSTPLDYGKPLWQMHYVENFASGSAIIVRLHHCIADGLALIQVLLSMTDKVPDAPPPEPPEPHEEPGPLGQLLKPAVGAVRKTFRTAETLLNESWMTIGDPLRVVDAAGLAASGTRALGKLVLSLPDNRTSIRGRCRVAKSTVWSKRLKVEDFKAIGKAFDATINDVLIATVAGALRHYLIRRGDQIEEGGNVRAMVPVNLRKPDEVEDFGNRFGLVLLPLPIGIENSVRRLQVMKERMDEIKHTPEAVVAFSLLNGMGLTPIQIEKLIMRFFAAKASLVLTNVPGPRERLYLAGKPISEMMFWVPSPGNLALGVSILSYAGDVVLGVAADNALVPDPKGIVEAFEAEFARLKRRVEPAPVKSTRKAKPRTTKRAKSAPQPA